MMAIAMMTMAFLPATSWAAILSVPWEQRWGASHFNIAQLAAFLTLTMTSTALVFFIWWMVKDVPEQSQDDRERYIEAAGSGTGRSPATRHARGLLEVVGRLIRFIRSPTTKMGHERK